MQALALSLILLVPLAAGCLGGNDEAATDTNELPETTPPLPPAETGNIIGAVVDPAQVPIGGARVFLLRNEEVTTLSARDGTYALADVEPGEHLVRAEAGTFEGQTFLVRVKSGQTTLLDIALEPEPTLVPRHETRELAGLLACSIVFASADNPSYPPCVEADPNARAAFDLIISPDPVRVLVEMRWDAGTALATNLAMDAQTIGTGVQDISFGDAEGPSILRLDIPGPLLERFYGDGGGMRVNVTAAPSLGDEEGVAIGGAIQQEFTLFVTQFFVEPGADDFSALSDE